MLCKPVGTIPDPPHAYNNSTFVTTRKRSCWKICSYTCPEVVYSTMQWASGCVSKYAMGRGCLLARGVCLMGVSAWWGVVCLVPGDCQGVCAQGRGVCRGGGCLPRDVFYHTVPRQTPPRQPLKRDVRILLECILVEICQ